MSHWGYGEHDGPATWGKDYSIANGNRQSPIDIRTDAAVYEDKLASCPLAISYGKENNLEICNNGHSMQATIEQPDSVITGGPLEGPYRLKQFHLHWGKDNSRGSEHTINGRQFAAELHLVHWNAGVYPTFEEAVDKQDGLAVIGVMIQVTDADNAAFKGISDWMGNIRQKGKKFKVKGAFDPDSLLPAKRDAYWTYPGSLTTPPLYESVRWIVLREPVPFSNQQMTALRSLLWGEWGENCIVDNYRPPQPLKDRQVKASFKSESD